MASAILSTYELIEDFGERSGERCGCCGKFTLFGIKYENGMVVKLCTLCDLEKSLSHA